MVISATCESPCHGCTERHPHCHSECGKYKEYKETLEKNRNDVNAKLDEIGFLRSEKAAVSRRYQKRKKDERR